MKKKKIKIKFVNGLNFKDAILDILDCVTPYYEFIDSSEPNFIIFGPYGNNIPPVGNYVRIGYFCENFKPDMTICDWAFGVPYENEVNHPRYKRIDWHGFNLSSLIKKEIDVEKLLVQKTKFCNFIYSNKVKYRETFFQKLSKYKHIDAPGKSMNNMPSIDLTEQGNVWERKRNFLSQYKFTIAFENYPYLGYNTEKLLDPMIINSLPIYLGNLEIGRHFNPKSFVNAPEYIKVNNSNIVNSLQFTCRPNLRDILPGIYDNFNDKVKRKIKTMGRNLKTSLQFQDFEALVERIIEIDRDDSLYAKYLLEPWLHENQVPPNLMSEQWKLIFG